MPNKQKKQIYCCFPQKKTRISCKYFGKNTIFYAHSAISFKDMQETSDILWVIRFLYKNRKLLVGFALMGALLAGITSFFLPKKYSSTCIIFPSGGSDVDKNLQFGMDLHNDQLMQLLLSASMRDSIVQKFHLIQYYEIDTSAKGWKEELEDKIQRDIVFNKTRYYSIEISAETKDAQFSANIVNEIVKITERLYWQLIRQNSSELLENAQKNYVNSESQVKLLADSLRNLVAQKGDTIQARLIRQNMLATQNNANIMKSKRDYVRERHEMPSSPLFIMDKGTPATKKSSPRYSINILLGALGMFFFGCLSLIIKDLYLKNKDYFTDL